VGLEARKATVGFMVGPFMRRKVSGLAIGLQLLEEAMRGGRQRVPCGEVNEP